MNQVSVVHEDQQIAQLDPASLVLGPSWDRIQAIGQMMARGAATVPRHLQGNEADCTAIAMQALSWRMNPFAVAQKTHVSQSGQLGYEGQLVNAVIQASGALDGDPEYEHFGDWDRILGKVEERKSDKGGKYYVATYTRDDERGLGVIVRAKLRGESKARSLQLLMSQAWPRFSTQWATDPKQQICYLAMRKFVRLHKPGVLMGVYTNDELGGEPGEKFMGPAEVVAPPPPPVAPSYDQAKFDANFPKWAETIRTGRKVADAYVQFVAARGEPFTPEQIAQLKAVKRDPAADATDVKPKDAATATTTAAAPSAPAQDAAPATPTKTYAEVADLINRAETQEDLNALDEHLGAVADAQHRAELASLIDLRRNELPPF